MIAEHHFKNIEYVNTEVNKAFKRLSAARRSHNPVLIQNAELEYFQAVQRLFTTIEEAVANLD